MTAPRASAAQARARLRGELDRAHSDVREELGRANATALGTAGTVATIAAVGLAALMAGAWTPARLPALAQVAWWAGVVAAAAGLALLGAVVVPAVPAQDPGPPTFWAPIAAHTDISQLADALADLAEDPAPRVHHLHQLASRARRKWARLRAALVVLATAGVLLTLTALTTAAT